MLIVDRLDAIPKQNTAVALGFFDGVHRGHARVIQKILDSRSDTLKTVLTFSKPAGEKAGHLLMTESMKAKVLEEMGVDCLVVLPFDEFKTLSPRQFVQEVLCRMQAKEVSCGFNYRFGHKAAGDTALLSALCREAGISVKVALPVLEEGEPISSTRIRRALSEGKVEQAEALLGRPFSFDFSVVHGDHRGRTLGFPTINQPFPDGFVHPRYGVYAASALVEGVWFPAVTNIGLRPTVGSDDLRAETHLIGYQGDLYHRDVTVRLHRFLRDETRFDSLEALRRAIAQDIQTVENERRFL